MPIDPATREARTNQMQNSIARGMECLQELWLYSYELPAEDRENFLYALAGVAVPLRMGLLAKANTLLAAINNVAALDAEYSPGVTVRQYFSSFIAERAA